MIFRIFENENKVKQIEVKEFCCEAMSQPLVNNPFQLQYPIPSFYFFFAIGTDKAKNPMVVFKGNKETGGMGYVVKYCPNCGKEFTFVDECRTLTVVQ